MPDEFSLDSKTFPQINRASSVLVNSTYSWINNAGFYATVNPTYYSFYYNNVRRLSYWLDGFVPTFHKEENGIFSTRIGNALVNSIGDSIFGRELLFRNVGKEKDSGHANETLRKVSDWSKESDFQSEMKKGIKYAQGLGTSLIKTNISSKGLWTEAVRLDYFYFEINSRGELQEITCFLKAYVDVSRQEGKPSINYYLVEKRYYEYAKEHRFARNKMNGIEAIEPKVVRQPKVVYQIHRYAGNILSNQTYDASLREDVRWDSLPKRIRESIKNDYGIIKIGEPQDLPFKSHLGAYLILADDGNISLPQIPFGTSILENIVSYLMGYDIAYSYFFRDMYQGKGTVLVPKFMQAGQNRQGNQVNVDPFTGLDQSMFTTFETTSQEKQTIEQIQFQLRSVEWSNIRDFLIENIAMTLQLSPRTIASFLKGGAIKTATQIDSEDTTTISFIDSRRAIVEKPINKLLNDVIQYYGWEDKVEIRFSKEGVTNTSQMVQNVGAKLQMGLIDLYSALQEIMIDADEDQVRERYEAIKRERQENMQEQLEMAAGQQLM